LFRLLRGALLAGFDAITQARGLMRSRSPQAN
jgi:hypothetical protein